MNDHNMATTNQNGLAGFDKLKAQISVFIGPTKDLTVTDSGTLIMAQGVVKTMSDFQKQIESARVALKKPYLDASKQIDSYAGQVSEPLETAIAEVKAKIVDWSNQEAKRRAEEQRKIDEQRRADERAAQAEREKIELEAKRKADEEAAALRKKQEAERKAFEAEQKKKVEALKMFGIDEKKAAEEKAAAARAMADRAAAEKAEQERRTEVARLEAQARAEREQAERAAALKAQEAALEAEKPKGTRRVRRWRIVDASKLPDKYWIPNETLIGVDVRGGIPAIDGIEIIEETVAVAR